LILALRVTLPLSFGNGIDQDLHFRLIAGVAPRDLDLCRVKVSDERVAGSDGLKPSAWFHRLGEEPDIFRRELADIKVLDDLGGDPRPVAQLLCSR